MFDQTTTTIEELGTKKKYYDSSSNVILLKKSRAGFWFLGCQIDIAEGIWMRLIEMHELGVNMLKNFANRKKNNKLLYCWWLSALYDN